MAENELKFVAFADLHVDIMHDSIKRLTAVIERAKSEKADFIINLGDLTYPDSEFLAREDGNMISQRDPKAFKCKRDSEKVEIMRMLRECGIPVYHVLGNHEADACAKEQSLKYLGCESSYYSFSVKNKHFIVLDSNFIKTDEGNYIGFDRCNYHYYPDKSLPFIPPEQLEWLEKDIVASPFLSIIFSHQSLTDTILGIKNRDAIQKLFHRVNSDKKRVVLCMNGHSHIDGLSKHDGVYFFDLNSISNFWIGSKYSCIRYSEEIDREYPYLKNVAPYRDPLFAVVTLTDTNIFIKGMKSEFVGPSPYDLGFPESSSEFISTPEISSHSLRIIP